MKPTSWGIVTRCYGSSTQPSTLSMDLFTARIIPMCGNDETAYAVLQHLDVRTKREQDLIRDVERRARMMFRTRSERPTDPTAIRVLIAECVIGKLGMRLTAGSFLEYLDQHDYMLWRLAGNATTNQRIQQLKRLYLNDVENYSSTVQRSSANRAWPLMQLFWRRANRSCSTE